MKRVILILLILAGGCAGKGPEFPYGTKARVLWINDGDTITVAFENRTDDPVTVRVLGVDTPEVWKKREGRWHYEPEPCGPEASYRTHQLTDGQVVTLEPDPFGQKKGKYQRELYHVRLPDGRLLSFILIAEGLGTYENYGHRNPHEAALKAAQTLAEGCMKEKGSQ